MRCALTQAYGKRGNRVIARGVNMKHQKVLVIAVLCGICLSASAQKKSAGTVDDIRKALETMNQPGEVQAFKAGWKIRDLARGGVDCSIAIGQLVEHLDDARPVLEISGGTMAKRYVGHAAKDALVAIGKDALPAVISRVKKNQRGSKKLGDELSIETLGEMQNPQAVGVLEKIALDPNQPYATTTINALRAIGGQEGWDALCRILKQRQKNILKLRAAQSLVSLDDSRDKEKARVVIEPYILGMIADPNNRSKSTAINLAGICRMTIARQALLNALDNKDELVVSNALYALSRVPAPASALEKLLRLADHPKHGESAINAIAAITDPNATPRLKQLITSEHPKLRSLAAAAIARENNTQNSRTLQRLMHDPDLAVRFSTLESLKDVSSANADELIIRATLDENNNLAQSATSILRFRTPADPEQTSKLLADNNPVIRQSTLTLLRNAKPTPAIAQPLMNTLADPEAQIRVLAAEALGNQKDISALIPIITAMRHQQNSLEMASSLGSICPYYSTDGKQWVTWLAGQMLAERTRDLNKIVSKDRETISREMQRHKNLNLPRAREQAIAMLSDKDLETRCAGAVILRIIGENVDLLEMQKILSDSPEFKRELAETKRWLELPPPRKTPFDQRPSKKNNRNKNRKTSPQPSGKQAGSIPHLPNKLQMVFWGANPKVVIDGISACVGGKIGPWTVKEIRKDSAVLKWRDLEQTLTLSP